MTVSVVGSGYVGTVVAACFAALGHDVFAVESDAEKLVALRAGKVPFYEDGLEDLVAAGLASGRLRFTDDMAEGVRRSRIIFLCVGTPPLPGGKADMTYALAAARQIAEALNGPKILVTKSTVPIGTCTWIASEIEEHAGAGAAGWISVVSNPEFLREASAIRDFLHPDRVVLGGEDSQALDEVEDLYRPILEQSFNGSGSAHPPLIRTTLATAEMIKYASNAFLATKISFANEMANICETIGADAVQVAAGMGLDARISPHFLSAGVGWGGSCFGKDIDMLMMTARRSGYEPELLQAAVSVNRSQRVRALNKLRNHLKTFQGKRVALLGLAFKPGTSDLRDAPSLDIAQALLEEDAIVTAYDPVVDKVAWLPGLRFARDAYDAAERADAVVIVTEWEEFLDLDLHELFRRMRGTLLVDGRNIVDPPVAVQAGFTYEGVGRASLGELQIALPR